MYTHIHMCIHIHVHMCIHIHIYIRGHVYTHTHMQEDALAPAARRLCAGRPRSFRATQTLLCSAPARWPALFQIARAAAPAPARHTPAALVSACVPRVHASMRIEEGWEKGGGRERGRGGHGERGETGQGRAGEGRRETGKEGKRGVDRWRQDCKKPGAAQLPWP